MFTHDDEIYLIARRNIAGTFDRAPNWLGKHARQVFNLLFYSFTRKRTALYHVDRDTATIKPLFDFQSCGDTAFAGIAPLKEPNHFYVLNYSSPIDGTDWPWIFGQLMPTHIYGTTIKFEKQE